MAGGSLEQQRECGGERPRAGRRPLSPPESEPETEFSLLHRQEGAGCDPCQAPKFWEVATGPAAAIEVLLRLPPQTTQPKIPEPPNLWPRTHGCRGPQSNLQQFHIFFLHGIPDATTPTAAATAAAFLLLFIFFLFASQPLPSTHPLQEQLRRCLWRTCLRSFWSHESCGGRGGRTWTGRLQQGV